MKAGIGKPPVKQLGRPYIINASRIQAFRRCPGFYNRKYNQNKILAGERRALDVGTAVHEVRDRLFQGKIDIPDYPPYLDGDEPSSFGTWLQRVMDEWEGWNHLDPTFEARETHFMEQEVWLWDPYPYLRSYSGILFLLKPDEVCQMDGMWRVVELKSVSPRINLENYRKEREFSVQDTLYGKWALEFFKGERVGPSVLETVRKHALPPDPLDIATSIPKFCAKCVTKANPYQLTFEDGKHTARMDEPKHRDEEQLKWRRWVERINRAEQKQVSFMADTFGRHYVRWSPPHRDVVWEGIRETVEHLANGPEEGVDRWIDVGGGACFDYNHPCDYLDICSEQTNLLNPAFVEREPDYVDMARKEIGEPQIGLFGEQAKEDDYAGPHA